MRSLPLAAALVASCLLAPSAARAQVVGDRAEITTLEQQLSKDETALSTSDCAEACRALGSMKRSADRLCQLDPGARCADARKRVDAATDRVRGACPQCAATHTTTGPTSTTTPSTIPSQQAEKPEPKPAPPPQAAPDRAAVASESAPRKGGCASCTTAGSAAPDATTWIALAALVAMRARRKRS